MQCEDGIPLLVGHLFIEFISIAIFSRLVRHLGGSEDLMYCAVPGKARIIDNDMNFPSTEFCGFFHELVNMFRI